MIAEVTFMHSVISVTGSEAVLSESLETILSGNLVIWVIWWFDPAIMPLCMGLMVDGSP